MTEKINGVGMRSIDAPGTRRTESAKPAAEAPALGRRDERGDRETVNLTPSARLLGKLEEAIRGLPAVDAGRVAALKDAIASGTYRVDPETVAAKLLQLERELGR